jgi:hypothetical protein
MGEHQQQAMVWLRRHWRRLLGPGAVLAFVLGVVGFHLGDPASPTAGLDWFRAVINTLQLFVLNVSGDGLPNFWTLAAAFLAPMVSFGAAAAALGGRVRHWLDRVSLLRDGADDVFLGGGETAAGIGMRRDVAHANAARPVHAAKLVGLDISSDAPLGRAMQAFSCKGFFHKGDALLVEELQTLHLHRARNVWVVTGDDLRNLEIARRVYQLVSLRGAAAQSSKKPKRQKRQKRHEAACTGGPSPDVAAGDAVRILVNVYNRHLVRAAASSMFPAATLAGAPVVEYFSMPRLAARTLLHEHPPLPPRLDQSQARPTHGICAPHVLIVGSGALAEALVVHVAQHCVFNDDPNHAVRISVVSQSAEDWVGQLHTAFPALAEQAASGASNSAPVARIAARNGSEVSLAPQIWTELQAEQSFNAIYVTCEKDLQTHEAALRLAALRDMAPVAAGAPPFIVACLQQPPGTLGALRQCHTDEEIRGLFDFPVFERCLLPGEDYPGQTGDRRAKQILAAYLRGQQRELSSADAEALAESEWNKDADMMRWSNRLSADHVDVKFDILQTLGLIAPWRALAPQQRLEQLAGPLGDASVVDLLSRVEHRRYTVERLLDGWLLRSALACGAEDPASFASGLPYSAQKSKLRLNVTLVPYDDLSTADPNFDQAKKDRDIIHQLREILKLEAARAA